MILLFLKAICQKWTSFVRSFPVKQANAFSVIEWNQDSLLLLDQTRLPSEEVYLRITSVSELVAAIQSLAVRGAPLLGVAGAYGCVLAALESMKLAESERKAHFAKRLDELEVSRPTAVNLKWAIDRQRKVYEKNQSDFSTLFEALRMEAKKIHLEDREANLKISQHGAEALREGAVLTICNSGSLATGGMGTAFGVLSHAFDLKKIQHVYACETRPLLQGLRLTAWELGKKEIPFSVICDSMAAVVLRDKKISAVVVGADRIAANGDAANKIGTYQLAILAKHFEVPFIVAAPTSTFDLSIKEGKDIPIEERNKNEILSVLGNNQPVRSFDVFNPAFDVTPHSLISMLVCEAGIIENPDENKMKRFFAESEWN